MADAARRYPEANAPVLELSLEARIAAAEQAVMDRDARIRRRTDAVVHRVRREAVRHAGGGLLVGVGTVVLAWWLNRLGKRHAPPAPPPAAAPAAAPPGSFEHLFRDAGLTLASLLPLLWPMLPQRWRRTVTPGTAGTLLTFIAPLLGKLFRRRPGPAPTP